MGDVMDAFITVAKVRQRSAGITINIILLFGIIICRPFVSNEIIRVCGTRE